MKRSLYLLVVLWTVLLVAGVAEARKQRKTAAAAEQEIPLNGVKRFTAHVPHEMKASTNEPPVNPPQGKKPESTKPEQKELSKANGRKFDLRHLPQTKPVPRDRAELPEPELNPVLLGTPAANSLPDAGAMSTPRARTTAAAPAPLLVFEGLNRQNNGAGSPPDTNGDVGPSYYIQSVNSSVGVYNKADGSPVAAFTFDSFMSQGGFGNLCDTNNFGDPVVLYDTFEDRWIITDFAFKTDAAGNVLAPAYQCFAASMNGDPVSGGWNFYSTQITDALNDYPKFGIWSDGLYMSANMFSFGGSVYQGARAWAYNKAQMYAGAPTVQVVTFNIGTGDFTAVPSNARLQTGTPPPGRPNFFVSTWNFLNAIGVYKFHVDWSDPSLSTFTGPDAPLTATTWPNSSVANAAQPGTTTLLDVLQIRSMVQAQYTNFAGAESIWVPHTVRRASGGLAAPRWYQADVTAGTVAANLLQAATWDPDNANVINRFTPSLALDRGGNMALGYTTSNGTLFPSLNYAGRLAGDAVNTFSKSEQTLFTGTASQTGTTRWGDYSSMTLDPDGCTFWYTSEYANPASQAFDQRWKTKVGSFRYSECTAVGAGGTVNGTVTVSPGGTPLAGATVMLGSRSTTTSGSGAYTFSVPAGTYPSISASNPGYTTASSPSVIITDGGTTTVNLALTAASPSGCAVDTTQFDFQNSVVSSVDTTTTPGAVQLLKPDVLEQTSTSVSAGLALSATSWAGQTFTPATTGMLARADLMLFCSTCTGTSPNLTLSVRATTAGFPSGADLASVTIPGFTSGSTAYYGGVLSPPITLTAGTQYALVVRPVANPSAGTYAIVRSANDVYAGGARVSGATSGTVWSTPLTSGSSTDMPFHVYYNNGYASLGTVAAATRDSNPAPGMTPIWSTLSWTATTPANTSVRFQVAGSSLSTGPFSFVGPDGTAATYFTTSAASLSQFYGTRYLRYKAYLATTDSTVTPVLNDVTMCFNDADCTGPSPVITAATAVCTNSTGNTASGPAGMTSYSWSVTNGSITGGTTSQTVTFTAGASGNVALLLNLTQPSGCRKTSSINVPIDVLPQPTVGAGGPTTICTGSSVTLTSSAPAGNQWYLNSNPIGGATGTQYVASAAGSYTVIVSDATCSSPASAATVVTVNSPPPVPTIAATTNGTGTQDQACPEQPLTLTATSAGATSFQWYSNNDTLNGQTSSTYQATGTATYYVTATVNGCTSAQSAGYVVQNPAPHSPFISFRNQDSSLTTLAICAGSSIIIDSDSATGIQWYKDGLPIATNGNSQSYTATQAGVYTAQLNALGCHSQFGRNVTLTIDSMPATPTITGDTNATGTQDQACPEQPLTLHASSTGAVSYQWYSDNAPIGDGTATLIMTGVGNISVTATNGTCTTARSATYVVQNPTPHSPFITFRGQASTVTSFAICQSTSVVIESDSATGIQWYKDGVAIPGAGSQNYTATQSGVYTAQLNALGCHSQFGRNVTLTVNPTPATPTITPGGPTTFCTGGSVTLTSSSASGNQWSLNGSPIGGATSNTYVATATGSYTVVVTASGCSSAASAATVVTVNPIPATPTITPGGPTTFCAGGSVTLTSSSASGNQWSLNGNPIGGATNNTYVATATGNYTVIVTASGCSSAASTATNVTVNPIPATPTITPGGPTTFCTGGSVTLTSSSASGNQWSLNGNPIGGATSNTYSATATGNYTVIVTTSGCSSAASAATSVTVNPIPATPTITPGGPTTFCTGGSVTLTSSSASGNQWSLNGNPIGGATNNTYVATATGNYTVVVTASGCSSAASAATNVTVNPIPATPTITPGGPTTFCAGGSVTLTSSSASGNQWFLNGNPIGGATSNTYSATATGNYTVIVTTSGCSSAASAATGVTVNPIPATPTITPGGPTTFCAGGSVTLTSSSASGNQWSLNGNPIGGATAQTYVASVAGDYRVVVTTSGCSSAASAVKTVVVNPNPNATITAPSNIITGSTGNAASVANAGAGATYGWSITNGTITAGAGTNAITFTAGAVGTLTLQVTVTTSAGCSDTKSANVTVNIVPITVTSVSPASGTPAGNTAVTINGTGFQSGATVTFGGTAATNVVVVSALKITAKTPAHAVGSVAVKVTNPDTTTSTLAAGYLYTPQFNPNGDGVVDPSDIFYLINYLFLGGPAPMGPAGLLSGDANGDGIVDPADIFYLVKYLFNGGPAPMSASPRATASSVFTPMSGSVSLGQPVLRGDRYVVPVILAWKGVAPASMSLKVAFDRGVVAETATIRRAGEMAAAQPLFEVVRSTAGTLSYLVSYDRTIGSGGSSVVAEIEIGAPEAARLGIDVDAAGTLLSDENGVRKATVGSQTLVIKGVVIEGETRDPRAPRSVE